MCLPVSTLHFSGLRGLSYTERHFARLDGLLQKSFLLDYTLLSMKKMAPAEDEEDSAWRVLATLPLPAPTRVAENSPSAVALVEVGADMTEAAAPSTGGHKKRTAAMAMAAAAAAVGAAVVVEPSDEVEKTSKKKAGKKK